MSISERSSRTSFVLGALALFLLVGNPSFGQNQQIAATLSGSVSDPTGLSVTGAKVTLTSPQNGSVRPYSTQNSGLYTFTLLPASVYILEVNAVGFKKYRQQGISLEAGQTSEQNVRLTVGSATESVEVSAQAPLLNVDNANISSDVSARQVSDLPLNLRNVISLATLSSSVSNAAEEQVVGAPGISGSADQDVSFLNFGGTFFGTAQYLLDGTWDTRLDWGGVIYVPSIDDVQEFKIQTNAFTAQYGFSSGNVVNVVTKSGTNQIHGDAWEFYRNSNYDARYYFNNSAQPAFHRNQFGATVGGPIYWIASSVAGGNYWPKPTTSALVNNFTSASSAAAHSNEYSGRVDYNLSTNDRLFGRWSQKYEQTINFPTYYGASDPAGPGVVAPNNRYSVDIGYTHIFSPTLTMNANLGVNRHVEQSVTQSFGYKSSDLGLPSFIDGIAPSFPEVQPQSYADLGAQAGLDNYMVPQTLWTGSVDLTKVRGKHQFAFGFMDVWALIDGGHYANTVLQLQTTSTAGPDPQNATSGTGDGFASFLMGVGSGTDSTGFNKFPATDKNLFGWYLQDDWKIDPRLTINLGLRYEIQTAPTERYNAQEYFDFNAVNPISTAVGANYPGELVFNSGGNRGLYDTQHKNFAPRIGAAYRLRDNLVLRAVYGVFFVPNYYGQGPNIGYSQGTPWVTSLNSGLNPFTTLSGNSALNCSNGGTSTPCQSAFPTGQVPATGNSLGGLTDVGFGFNPAGGNVRP